MRLLSLFFILSLSACMERSTGPAPVTQLGLKLDAPSGAVMVSRDDTLWRISQRYRLPLRDIIELNGLSPPYALAEGQRILLPRPLEHKVGADDTLTRIAHMYQVPVSQLVKTNGLQAPYRIGVGQTVRIPQSGNGAAAGRPAEVLVASAAPVPKIEKVEVAALDAPVMREALAPPAHQARPAPVLVKKAAFTPPAAPRPVTTVLGSKRPDFNWPLRGQVVSAYGAKDGGLYNDGINIAAPRGTPVAAAADGIVAYVGSDLDSYGNLVLIRHSGGMVTAYAHMASVSVKKGAGIRKGQPIGTVGSTGAVANSQLHFEVRKGAETLDPKKYLG